MWVAPFELRAILTVECAACPFPTFASAENPKPIRADVPAATPIGSASLMDMRVRGGDSLALPTLPRGWRLVDGQPICPLHDIKIEDRPVERRSESRAYARRP